MKESFFSILDQLVQLNTRLITGTSIVLLLATLVMIHLLTEDKATRLSDEIQQDLFRKGTTLVNNNAIAIRQLASDNAITSVSEMVDATVRDDPDIVYGIYMDADGFAWIKSQDLGYYATTLWSRPYQGRSEKSVGRTLRENGIQLEDEASQWA